MRIAASARKHYQRDKLTDAGVLWAAGNPVYRASLENDSHRRLYLGFDDTGKALELIVLFSDHGGWDCSLERV